MKQSGQQRTLVQAQCCVNFPPKVLTAKRTRYHQRAEVCGVLSHTSNDSDRPIS